MNGYPYPVLTEVDSAYKEEISFNIDFLKYTCDEDKVVLTVGVLLNSETLKKHIELKKAELVVKAITDIRSMVFHFEDFQETLEININNEDIRANDTIKLTAFIVAKQPFVLTTNEEMEKYFGENFSIELRKGDLLAISNDEKLNYNTTNNDFIMIKSSDDMEGKGLKIRLSDENHIEILVGPEFKHSYAILKDPKVSPILNSHIVFEAIVYALVEIAQQKEDYSNKEWYRLFSQAFTATGETLEDFKEKANDNGYIDFSYIFEMAQLMISNSLETSVINVSKLGDKK